MRSGKIKFFNRKRGFGFVIDDETGQDYFMTYRSFISPMPNFRTIEGAEVLFEPYDATKATKGPVATNITVVKYAEKAEENAE